ncbi:MAG TPA: ABC transporter permease [Cyclobacteriaceae bacterium]|nr:ABC transporter permease [Cyclobacteriaceae bacterium]HRJ80600.1 ABC transporter permease [Cyclobacteriaceae bacterium]
MKLEFFIARRYLLSRRKKNFINIISILSLVGVAFSAAAIIIVLSVFNGLGDLLRSLNNSFDPEIKIEAARGKSFPVSDSLLKKIEAVEGVALVTEVIEDYAYVRYRDANQVITLKGVSDNFIDQHRIDDKIVAGELRLNKGDVQYAIIGRGVQYTLSIAVGDDMFPLQVYYINNVKSGTLDPSRLYSRKNILVGAAFSIVQNFDENYVLVPLSFAQELLRYDNRRTSLEIKTKPGTDIFNVQDRIKTALGESYLVLNHEEQHKDLYRLLKMEKLFTFLALSLLLGISSINIFFSLMMLALDKKKDISILAAMGANENLIRKIFVVEGGLIAFGGALLGLLLGGIFCWLQLNYGIISMGMETSVTEGYPIKVKVIDFVSTLAVVSVLTFLISWRPAILASRSVSVRNL